MFQKAISKQVERISEGILQGRRSCLAEGITLIESTNAEKRAIGQDVLQILLKHQKRKYENEGKNTLSFRIGLSGPPGSGKSTFIERLGKHLTGLNHKVSVLAVDPSSVASRGSLLGDKTRMLQLSRDPNAYIRPSPASGHLGGVTRTTNEAIILCEATGFDIIIIETVGIGQSEHKVVDMVDMFNLLIAPASGDELQGIKKGVVELSDLIIVNKADGDLLPAATRSAYEYTSALKYIRPRTKVWKPTVKCISSLNNHGVTDIWKIMEHYRQDLLKSGLLEEQRQKQLKKWMWNYISDNVMKSFINNPTVQSQLATYERQVADGVMPPGLAADMLLSQFFKRWS